MRKEIKRMLTRDKNEITEFISHWEKMGKTYFWTPPATAFSRRKFEKENGKKIEFTYEGNHYNCSIEVSCSCRNIYVTRTIKVNGKALNIRALKKLIN